MADRTRPGRATRPLPASEPPQDDPGTLVVRHERQGPVCATVFGELIEGRPGRLRLEYSRQPWNGDRWQALDAADTPLDSEQGSPVSGHRP
jgi:hypothetical protein